MSKYNIWENNIINELLQSVVVIRHNLDNNAIDNLPINIDKRLLYNICTGYMSMYEKLLNHDLIKTANPESTPILH